MAAKQLDAYLGSAGGLARVAAHANRLMKLQRVFGAIAPTHLATASRVANLKSGKVVIHADSGAVAARLRQMLPRLVDNFLAKGCEVTEIEVKVQPADAAPQQAAKGKSRVLGGENRARLTQLAGSLDEETPIRRAIEKLVARSG